MKKKTAPKKATHPKTVKRTAPRSSRNQTQTIIIRRVFIMSACLVMIAGIVGMVNKSSLNQAVAGVTIVRGMYKQATITLPSVANATGYNIYYRTATEPNFSNAVRNISPTVTTYTVSYLKPNTVYYFKISALQNGKETYFSPTKPLSNLQSM